MMDEWEAVLRDLSESRKRYVLKGPDGNLYYAKGGFRKIEGSPVEWLREHAHEDCKELGLPEDSTDQQPPEPKEKESETTDKEKQELSEMENVSDTGKELFYEEMCKSNGFHWRDENGNCSKDGKKCDASGNEDFNFGCHIMS